MDSETVAAQRVAIQEVRTRYERGEIGYEDFRRALDAVVLARDEDECRAVLAAIPASPMGSLAALDPVKPAPPAPMPTGAGHKWVVAFMASAKKTRRRWRMQPQTHALAVMGEVKVDLGMAELPPRATLDVAAIMGDVTVYVPRSLRVAVHGMAVMGEINALGESTSGMVAFGDETHTPDNAAPAADLVIRVWAVMAAVKVVLTDGKPVVTVSEMVQEALRSVTSGLARGFVGGAAPKALEGPEQA